MLLKLNEGGGDFLGRKKAKIVVVQGPVVFVDGKEVVSCRTEFQCDLSIDKDLITALRLIALKLNHQLSDTVQQSLKGQLQPVSIDEET